MKNFIKKTKIRIRNKTTEQKSTNNIMPLNMDIESETANITTNSENKLVTKKERFCEEYIVDLNILKAGKRAGYKSETHIYNLMKDKGVLGRISRLQYERQLRTKITADRVLVELANIAFFNIKDIYKDDGSFKEITSLTREVASAIQSVEYSNNNNQDSGQVGTIAKVRAEGKLVALEKLAKHLGMFMENNIPDPILLANMERKRKLENLTEIELKQLSELTKKTMETYN